MQLYGYTLEGEVVAAQLPPCEIVARGIDAWRLDLFDPDPIGHEIGGQPLRFRRLSDLSFSYECDERIVVGLHDGKNTHCVHGKPVKAGDATILEDMRTCDQPFDYHFCKYLETLEAEREKDLQQAIQQRTRAGGIFVHGRISRTVDNFLEGKCPVLAPFSANNVQLRGGQLHLNGGVPLKQGQLTGATFHYQPLPAVAVPEPLKWLHRTMARWNPTIFGAALRHALLGECVTHVDFMIDAAAVPALKKHLEKELGTKPTGKTPNLYSAMMLGFELARYEFSHDDCQFAVFDRTGDPLQEWLGRWQGYSADDMFSSKPGQINASRIALFDLSKRQARKLVPKPRPVMDVMDAQRYMVILSGTMHTRCAWWQEHLKEEGYRFLGDESAAESAKKDEGVSL